MNVDSNLNKLIRFNKFFNYEIGLSEDVNKDLTGLINATESLNKNYKELQKERFNDDTAKCDKLIGSLFRRLAWYGGGPVLPLLLKSDKTLLQFGLSEIQQNLTLLQADINQMQNEAEKGERIKTIDHLLQLMQQLKKGIDAGQKNLYRLEPEEDKEQPFTPSHNPFLNEKMLGLVLGDTFIRDTPLEGAPRSLPINHLIPILKQYLKGHPDTALQTLLANIEKAAPFFTDMESWSKLALETIPPQASWDKADYAKNFFKKFYDQLAVPMAKKIEALQPGDALILPGGWVNMGGGHAMLYHVERLSDGSYKFAFINSGGGVDYHDSSFVDGQLKFNPALQYTQVDPETLKSPQFWFSLYKCFIPFDLDGEEINTSAQDVYQHAEALGGQRVREGPDATKRYKAQMSGTCSWQCWTGLLRLVLPNDAAYKQLMLFVRGQDLCDYYALIQSKRLAGETINSEQITLLRRSAETYSAYILKNLQDGLCEEATAQKLKLLPEKILSDMQLWKLAEGPALGQFDQSYLRMSDLSIHNNMNVQVSPKDSVKTAARPPSFLEFSSDPARLESSLQTFMQQLADYEKSASSQEVLGIIENMVERLVLTSSTGFATSYDKNGDKSLNKLMESFEELGNRFVRHYLALPPDERSGIEPWCCSQYLLYLGHRCATSFSKASNFLEFKEENFMRSRTYRCVPSFKILQSSPWTPWIGNPVKRKAQRILINYLDHVRKREREEETISLDAELSPGESEINFNELNFSDNQKLKGWMHRDPSRIWANMLKDPEVKVKLCQKYPQLAAASDRELVKVLFQDMSGEFLPKSLCSLRKLYLINKIASSHPSLNPIAREEALNREPFEKLVKLEFNKNSARAQLLFDITLKGSSIAASFSPLDSEDCHVYPISKKGLQQAKGQIYENNRYSVLRWRDAYNKSLLNGAVEELTVEETQQLLSMGTVPGIVVIQIMDYISKHPHIVKDPDYQQLFMTHLFYTFNLEKSIESSPQMLSCWLNFLEAGYQEAKKIGDSKSSLFYLYLRCMTPGDENRTQALESLRQMKREAEKGAVKAEVAAYLIFALGATAELKPQEALEVCANYTLLNTRGNLANFPAQFRRDLQSTFRKALPLIEGLPSEAKLQAAQAIAEDCFAAPKGIWESEGPYTFTLKNAEIEVDLQLGIVCQKGKVIGEIPEMIKEHEDYKRVVGKRQVLACYRKGDNQIVLQVSRKKKRPKEGQKTPFDEYQMTFDQSKLAIEKIVPGSRNLVYIPPKNVEEGLRLPWSFISNKIHWKNFDEKLDPIEKWEYLIEDSVGMPEAQITFSVDQWAGINLDMRIESIKTGEIISRAWLSEYYPQYVALLGLQGGNQEMLFWRSSGGNERIEFPGIHVEFLAKGFDYPIRWKKEPDYYISADRSAVKTLPSLKQFIRLENGVKQKILIPKLPIDLNAQKKGALVTEYAFKYDQKNDKETECYAFDVLPDGTLKAKSVNEKLFLIYLHLAEKNYVKAVDYLNALYPIPASGLSENQLGQLKKMIDLMDAMRDGSPEASLVRLRVAVLLLKDNQDHSELLIRFPLTKDLNTYYRQRMHTLPPLTIGEEQFLAELMSQSRRSMTLSSSTDLEEITDPLIETFGKFSFDEMLPFSLDFSSLVLHYPKLLEKALNSETKKEIGLLCRCLGGQSMKRNQTQEQLRRLLLYIASSDDPVLKAAIDLPTFLNTCKVKDAQKSFLEVKRIQQLCMQHRAPKAAAPDFPTQELPPEEQKVSYTTKPEDHPLKPYPELQASLPAEKLPKSHKALLAEKGIEFQVDFPSADEELDQELLSIYKTDEKMVPAVKHECLRMQEEIRAAHTERVSQKRYTPNQPWDKILKEIRGYTTHVTEYGNMQQESKEIVAQLLEETTALNSQILAMANGIAIGSKELVEFELGQRADTKRPLFDIGEVLKLYEKNRDKVLEDYNPSLNAERRKELSEVISQYRVKWSKLNQYLVFRRDFETRQQQVKGIATQLEEQTEMLKGQILALANGLPTTSKEKLEQELGLLAKTKRPLSLDDIIRICLQKNGKALENYNPSLDTAKRGKLSQLVTLFLMQAAQLQRFQRAMGHIEKSETSKDPMEKAEWLRLATDELAQPNVVASADFPLLVFSYYADVRLWDPQVALIKDLLNNPKDPVLRNRIVQLIMGSGKTKVILPLLALLLSDGQRVPCIVVPDESFETNNLDLQLFSGEYLKQPVETFYIERDRQLTSSDLDQLEIKLQQVKLNKSYLMTSPWSIYQLILMKKTLRNQLADQPSKQLEIQLDKVSRLLNTLKSQGVAILDEADTMLNILKEVNCSFGALDRVEPSIQNFFTDLLIHLNQEPDLARYFAINSPNEAIFTEQDYSTHIKQKLTGWAIEWLKQQKELKPNLSPQRENELQQFLTKDARQTSIPSWIKDEKWEALLVMMQLTFNDLLPNCARKNQNQHYGLSQQKNSFISIPYNDVTKEPQEGSEFGLVGETILYSMLYASKMGLDGPRLEAYIHALKEEAIAEARNRGIDIEQTKAYKKFESLALLPNKSLFQITEQDLAQLLKMANSDAELKMQIAKNYAVKEIIYYKQRINATFHHLVHTFADIIGFTGTLWNQDSFTDTLEPDPRRGVDGKTILAWMAKNPLIHIVQDREETADQDPLFSLLKNYNALVDAGAWFRGIPNSKVAKLILNAQDPNSSKIKGVAYINERNIPPGTKGTFVLLERGKKVPIPLSDSTLDPSERFTYYHIGTGLDLNQAWKAKALMTIDPNMIMRDALQGGRRMRKLDYEQSADCAMRSSIVSLIGGSTMPDLLRFLATQQALRQEKNNERSFLSEAKFIVELFLETALDVPELGRERRNEITKQLRPFLVKATQNLVAGIEQDSSVKDFINGLVEQLRPIVANIPELSNISIESDLWKKVSAPENATSLDKLKLTLERLAAKKREKGAIRDTLKMKTLQMGMSQQTQTHTQTQVKTQVNVNEVTDMARLASHCSEPIPWILQDRNYKQSDIFYLMTYRQDNPEVTGGGSCNPGNYLLAHQSKFPPLAKIPGLDSFFSNKIHLTRNYRDISKHSEKPGEEIVAPFGQGFKPTTLCLMYENKSDPSKTAFYYLDPEEVQFFIEQLKKNRDSGDDREFIRLALVHPTRGLVYSGKEPIDVTANPDFICFTTETKIWNGDLAFTPQEIEYLKTWIARIGPDAFEEMFLNVIIRLKPQVQRAYPNSILHHLIEERRGRKTDAHTGF